MRYGFIQRLMWTGFKGTFRKQLSKSFDERNPAEVMKNARKKYRKILSGVDEFEKGDRFLMNILSCTMLSAVLLSTEKKYSLEEVRVYYRRAMFGNFLMKAAAKKSRAYTAKGRELLKSQAKESEKNTNPYSWKFSVEDDETLNQYTATFHTCGVCFLMTKLGLKEYIPAMCSLDYDMAALNNTEFSREFTLAGSGKYCDCHYNHIAIN